MLLYMNYWGPVLLTPPNMGILPNDPIIIQEGETLQSGDPVRGSFNIPDQSGGSKIKKLIDY